MPYARRASAAWPGVRRRWSPILAYNAMQIGVFGLFGAAATASSPAMGVDLPWWVWTYVGIALVAVLGYRRVDLSAKVLAVLVVLEYLVVLVIDAAILVKGGDSGLSAVPFTRPPS